MRQEGFKKARGYMIATDKFRNLLYFMSSNQEGQYYNEIKIKFRYSGIHFFSTPCIFHEKPEVMDSSVRLIVESRGCFPVHSTVNPR